LWVSKPILLKRHPSTPAAVPTPWARFGRDGRLLRITFRIPGDTDMVALPAPIERGVKQSERRRADRLWEHTCFECFFRPEGEAGYLEFNFSPSMEWAAYRFDDYREGMRNAEVDCPAIVSTGWRNRFELSVMIVLPSEWRDRAWHVNLAAVIEERDGAKSYWALAHPPGKPDFHRPDCFVLKLPAD
jgi:hypothetical protein